MGVASLSNITITCTGMLSGPAVSYLLWTGPDDTKIEQLSFDVAATVTNSLEWTPVRQSNAGTYTCTVSVGASNMSHSVNLAVSKLFS